MIVDRGISGLLSTSTPLFYTWECLVSKVQLGFYSSLCCLQADDNDGEGKSLESK
jgi:hypothetical protein